MEDKWRDIWKRYVSVPSDCKDHMHDGGSRFSTASTMARVFDL